MSHPSYDGFVPEECRFRILGGAYALVIRCLYFLPIGILSYLHFGKMGRVGERGLSDSDLA